MYAREREREREREQTRHRAMRILVAGGTGMVGTHLVHALLARGDAVVVLGRSREKIEDLFGSSVGATTLEECTETDMQGFDAVVNLAGENVGAAMRWTSETLEEILQSRVNVTSSLAKLIRNSGSKARFLSASGISAYGYDKEADFMVKDEDSPTPQRCASDALTEVTWKWERSATEHCPEGHPIVLLRIGVVLCRGAGALGKMELPFRMCVGGRIGSGKQGMSWISLRDVVGSIVFLLDRPDVCGPVNLTSGFSDQAAFAQALASALSRPCLLPAPGFAVKMLLGKDMAQALVLSNYRVEPKRLKDAGFCFHDLDLAATLAHIYSDRDTTDS